MTEPTGLELEQCSDCQSLFDPDEGCTHDGRRLCRDCLGDCPECRADLRDAWLLDMSG